MRLTRSIVPVRRGANCSQVVDAAPCDRTGSFYADLDIDHGQPLEDVAVFAVRMGELLAPGRQDYRPTLLL